MIPVSNPVSSSVAEDRELSVAWVSAPSDEGQQAGRRRDSGHLYQVHRRNNILHEATRALPAEISGFLSLWRGQRGTFTLSRSWFPRNTSTTFPTYARSHHHLQPLQLGRIGPLSRTHLFFAQFGRSEASTYDLRPMSASNALRSLTLILMAHSFRPLLVTSRPAIITPSGRVPGCIVAPRFFLRLVSMLRARRENLL